MRTSVGNEVALYIYLATPLTKMNSHQNVRTKEEHLEMKLRELGKQQDNRDTILSKLVQERNRLQQELFEETSQHFSESIEKHYRYILPLVKEIYFLELNVKDYQKKYEKLKMKCEATHLGQAIFAASLGEDDCILKRLARELTDISKKIASSTERKDAESSRVTNITYQCTLETRVLKEELGFTILNKKVHVRVKIKSETAFRNSHIICPASASIGINSDTYVPHLEEKIRAIISEHGPVSDVVSLISKYIEDDMAPYVIIIPMKKKAKKSKTKSPTKLKAFYINSDKDLAKDLSVGDQQNTQISETSDDKDENVNLGDINVALN